MSCKEFTIYNFNLGLYGVTRITFELAPAGDWIQTFDIDVLLQRWVQDFTIFHDIALVRRFAHRKWKHFGS